MVFDLGLKALKRLVQEEDSFAFNQAKLSPVLFRGEVEKNAFSWIDNHVTKYKVLPKMETFLGQFPDAKNVEVVEPPKYYLDLIEQRFICDVINNANLESQEILKTDRTKYPDACNKLKEALNSISYQLYRQRILDVGQELPKFIVDNYYHKNEQVLANFGWDYLDHVCGGVMGGDVVSFVGRPATGKTFFSLYSTLTNWRKGLNVLFVSMEMGLLSISQRIAAMYAGTNLEQLKVSGYSTQTFNYFSNNIKKALEEPSKFYVVDGNIAATPEDIYNLCSQLKCSVVFIDGAYLLRNRNAKLDRYNRVSENVEVMKKMSTDLDIRTFASWQFNRQASKKLEKQGAKVKLGLEDIGYSDAIPQISSVVLGLMEEDSVETLIRRRIDIMKGRNGEVGSFDVNWNFKTMDFSEIQKKTGKQEQLQHI